ncbi:MAG: DUF4065 domain-containing protein [Synergistaceae bacterium]|nr:DUF4065 domain-containing protein [Synergistaceae bacterium]
MTHSAKDVARYILGYFSDRGSPISNLQLQKLLYFCWIDHFNRTGEHLFEDPFVAWALGPVVVSVYREYCSYSGSPIFAGSCPLPEGLDKVAMDACLGKYEGWSGYRLVEASHRKGGAWDAVYGALGKGAVVDAKLIERLECRRVG